MENKQTQIDNLREKIEGLEKGINLAEDFIHKLSQKGLFKLNKYSGNGYTVIETNGNEYVIFTG